jgi:hypothetical protein
LLVGGKCAVSYIRGAFFMLGDRMRFRSLARTVVFLASLILAGSAHAQGSWLPYGTLGASDITVTPSGVVWLIAREPHSIRTSLVLGVTRFFTPDGMPARIAADVNGFPWLINTDGSVWHYTRGEGSKESWVPISIKAIDIAVGANGSVWVVDTDHHVVRLNGDKRESIGGSAVRIAVDPSGNPWVVNAKGEISQWTGSSWKNHPGTANDIAVAPDGSIFILGTTPVHGGYEVLRLNGSEWQHIVGGGGVAIAAGSQAVFVAQDSTTGIVLSSATNRLRTIDGMIAAASPDAIPNANPVRIDAGANSSAASPTKSNDVSTSPSSSNAAAARSNDQGNDKGGSIPGSGVVSGAVGLLGGLLGKAAPVAAGVAVTAVGAANPVPSPQAVAAAAGAAAGGAAAGAALGAAGDLIPGGGGGAGNPASTGNGTQPDKSKKLNDQPDKSVLNRLLNSAPPLPQIPVPGKLTCPIVGAGMAMEKLCEIGRDALKLRFAPPSQCAAPAFEESRNGGECWVCPATFMRNSASPVDSANACQNPGKAQFSVATLVSGCSTYKAPPGYGTPFRDSPNGSECYVCPLPFKWSFATVTHLSKGDLAACVGKGRDLVLWQLGQYPETGAYRFMPGLLSIALADPKAVDAFLNIRAKGDSILKRELWAKMIADPSSSPELKALLFASLLKVAKQDTVSALAKQTLGEFESYMRSRRFYVAQEALRMYRKAREVDSAYVKLASDSGGIRGAAVDAAQAAATDFKTYAWSGVMPDSSGTAFVLASEALARLGAPNGLDSAVTARTADLAESLAPVTDALEKNLEVLQDKRDDVKNAASAVSTVVDQVKSLKSADPSLIKSTLLGSAMKVSNGVLSLLGKDQLAAQYEKYLEQMNAPLRVKEMLESTVADEKQTLMLYWALATSPHKAAQALGEGTMTGVELCSSDAWTAAQCSAAKTMIAAAAKAAGYSN